MTFHWHISAVIFKVLTSMIWKLTRTRHHFAVELIPYDIHTSSIRVLSLLSRKFAVLCLELPDCLLPKHGSLALATEWKVAITAESFPSYWPILSVVRVTHLLTSFILEICADRFRRSTKSRSAQVHHKEKPQTVQRDISHITSIHFMPLNMEASYKLNERLLIA